MIYGSFHKGSGLGDQLMRYITVRTLAEKKGWDWLMLNPENFKGKDFMEVKLRSKDMRTLPSKTWNEKDVRDANGVDIRSYDPEINFVQDDTAIDGYFEDYKYWGHNLDAIREWLKVEPLEMPDDVCVIGFRGGEFATVPDLFLPVHYWRQGIEIMRKKNPNMKFQVHTDDPQTSASVFPDFPIIHDIGLNWRSVRYAHHLIIANSAFYVMPSLLGDAEEVIAPRYWARYNTKTWARPASYYERFTYIWR